MDYHISKAWLTIIILLAIWEVIWKGIALWHAARNQKLNWFLALIIINSAGILPIFYLTTHRNQS